ncbi:hypothetical protein OHB26_38665 [Nocardia sp. NBC_01503]|uniref:hypothetical protein n=1 Tax=Nocardia sp. NBC_01503 TaxID=2975997 RepID=UPI002E7AD76D|nr:hypothetical protein [Nocardia sp. NBC_01503]WTL32703.1 hypothetical protein OHB26_38665 [Nocardia sp. NBC_01503]
MSLYLSYEEDPHSGRWTVTGEDGHRTITITHESKEVAAAEVEKSFGRKASPRPPEPPPGWHRFTLIDSLFNSEGAGPDDPTYTAIKAAPPEGCVPEPLTHCFSLECTRPGTDLLDAISTTCAEIRNHHGLLLTDLGVEKVDEWLSDGKDAWGARILAQLLLMSVERASLLGYTPTDLTRFIQRVTE